MDFPLSLALSRGGERGLTSELYRTALLFPSPLAGEGQGEGDL